MPGKDQASNKKITNSSATNFFATTGFCFFANCLISKQTTKSSLMHLLRNQQFYRYSMLVCYAPMAKATITGLSLISTLLFLNNHVPISESHQQPSLRR